jgi:hypothetical protein
VADPKTGSQAESSDLDRKHPHQRPVPGGTPSDLPPVSPLAAEAGESRFWPKRGYAGGPAGHWGCAGGRKWDHDELIFYDGALSASDIANHTISGGMVPEPSTFFGGLVVAGIFSISLWRSRTRRGGCA